MKAYQAKLQDRNEAYRWNFSKAKRIAAEQYDYLEIEFLKHSEEVGKIIALYNTSR